MERGAWWATVHKVVKSWTCVSDTHTHTHRHTHRHTHTQTQTQTDRQTDTHTHTHTHGFNPLGAVSSDGD